MNILATAEEQTSGGYPLMEVNYEFTRSDWTLMNTQINRDWLYGLKPMSPVDYWFRWFLVVFFILCGIGIPIILGIALGLNYVFFVGAGALIGVLLALTKEVFRQARDKRSLLHEFFFRNKLTEKLIDGWQVRNDRLLREQEKKGQLELRTRYCFRMDPSGYSLITDYSATGNKTQVEGRNTWDTVKSIDLYDQMLAFRIGDKDYVFIPRRAFPDEEACERFARVAEEYRIKFVANKVAFPDQPQHSLERRRE
jgi:hypothetical protein